MSQQESDGLLIGSSQNEHGKLEFYVSYNQPNKLIRLYATYQPHGSSKTPLEAGVMYPLKEFVSVAKITPGEFFVEMIKAKQEAVNG